MQGVESSVDDRIEAVACPAGKLPVGGGAVAFNDSGTPREVALTASRPTDDGWLASAGEVAPTDEAWHLTVYAVCANAA